MDNAIAIIGMAGRFPQAGTLERFWENLRNGIESIRPVPEEDLLAAGVPRAQLSDPGYVRSTGLLEDVDLFDAPFFGLSAREASLLDPQHRILLEIAWEALEGAGYDAERIDRPVGLYAGASVNSYFLYYLFAREHLLSPDGAQLFMGNDNNFLATRTSYKLGLRGPSLTVQTACSTSLVAVHLGCQSLLNGECDMALAGGVSVRVPQVGYLYRPGGILSPDGHCRAFDAAAGGSVMGSGVGMVVLKRLEDAIADRDPIRAVILGSAVNNDGAFRIGYTAPSVEGQSAAIAEALAIAQVEPGEIGYVEAHGSGTSLGDPIELAALQRVFGEADVEPGSCAIGSVKTNIGHLDAAAGVAGLIKTVLSLEHEEIPPSLHYETPNPAVDAETSPFAVNARLRKWMANGMPRRAGVSSFGMGGTNAHVVLQEAPRPEPSGASRPWQLLLLSAATPAALDTATGSLAAHLGDHPEEPLPDVAYTLSVGRKAMRHRRALVVQDRDEATRVLAAREPGRLLEGVEERTSRSVAFLLPGLGEHYPGMGMGIYESEPAFRNTVDLCCLHLTPILGRDLREVLFPELSALPKGALRAQPSPPDPLSQGRGGTGTDAFASSPPLPGGGKLDLRALLGRATIPSSELDRTAFAQPALFVLEFALAQLWKEWGVEPAALLGYSLGEYTAACLAGVFSLEDALRVVALRAQAIERLPAGAMLAVPLPEAEVLSLLGEDLALSAVNGSEICVVGGPAGAIQALEERLAERGLATRRLRTSHAFHSPTMRPVADELTRLLSGIKLQAPQIPFLSNVTGTWITAEEAVDPAYWVRHLLQPVRLADGLAELWQDRERLLLEVGPGAGLSSLALQHPSAAGNRIAVPSLPGAHEPRPDHAFALNALGRLWLGGARLDWTGFWKREERRRLRLPTYPFERRRYWIEEDRAAPMTAIGRLPQEASVQEAAVATTRHTRPALPTPYVPAEGPVEEGLAAIFRELLGIEPVGRHDSFFDLGGHSLLAAQLMTRLLERFGAELPLTVLFEAPTVGLLAEAVEAAAGQDPGSLLPPILPAPRDADLPLSFSQERLWFLDRLIPENPVYHVPLTTRLRGRLDGPVLAASLNEVTRRHEALRTTFACVDDLPVQVIAPSLRLDPPVIDLGALPAGRREPEAWKLIETETARPFDLARGPLARALLVRLEEEHHLALFNLHHIVADGWSLGVLMQELGILYAAFAAGQPSPLAALPVQYADYAVWQRQWLQGERLEEQVAFWRERLAGAPAALDLPFDRPRPAIQRFQGAKIPFRFDAGDLSGLTGLQRASQVTTFMVLLAAYQTLMSRLSGQEDLVVGSPVAGRSRRETEGLIGFFVNTLVFRGDLSGDPTFSELLGRVRQVTLEAYAREDLPFERLVEQLQPERSLSHSPIFQVALVLLNTPASTLELPGLTLETIDTWVSGTKWDMAVSMEERAEGLVGYWEYDSDLFDRTTVHRFVGQLRELLVGGVAAPERRLSEIPWISEPERLQVLSAWNDTAVEYPEIHNLQILLEEQARRTPEAEAVTCEGDSLTYRELHRRANQLAHWLRSVGVGPETLVATAVERSCEMAVSLLGILKAGGAYVPLDPDYPEERLRFMLDDSGAAVLLLGRREVPGLEGFAGPVLRVPAAAGELARQPESDLPCTTTGESLAYVIYTSGSTGRPKGAMNTHRAIVNRLLWMQQEYGLTAADRVLQKTPLSFDVSVWEVFWPLLTGARLVVARPEGHKDAAYLARLIREQEVTTLHFVPSMLRIFLEEKSFEEKSAGLCGSIRRVICSGEALPYDLQERFFDRFAPHQINTAELHNLYGPTEAAVDVTYWACVRGGARPIVPIGRPVANTRIYLLDREMRPLPAGVAGELYIGGVQPARGYIGRPELTADRFVPDPFAPEGSEGGGRLYRTGDLARHLPDGAIEYLGRIDHQVKLRGIRIELGEIETVLVGHSGVEQAVVITRREPSGDWRLVAYVVAPGIEPADLREHCRRLLPEPMVPSIIAIVDALPLTPAGKVDRRALTSRPVERPTATSSYKPPGDELERQVAEIWQEVLGLERVGVEDNFFDLGGHSLALVQVQRKIRHRLSREVSVVDLFRTPTIAALARSLSVETDAGAEAAQQGDERAQRRRALRDRRRSTVESPADEVYEYVE